MPLISRHQLADYFARRNNRFTNSRGIEIKWHDESGAYTSVTFPMIDVTPPLYEIRIITTEEGYEDFIEGFRIETTNDIDKLGYNNSWIRYLNGQAEVEVASMELEAAFSFRIYKSRTTITSLDLHFYDECYRHLTLTEEFLKYFNDNEGRLFAAMANRYKL